MSTNTTVITKSETAIERFLNGESTGNTELDNQLNGIKAAFEMNRKSTVSVAYYIAEIYRTGTYKELGFKSESELLCKTFDFTRDTVSKYKRVAMRYIRMVNGTPTVIVNGESAEYSVGALTETLTIPEDVVHELHDMGFLNPAMSSKAVKQLSAKVKGIEFKDGDSEEHKRALLVTAMTAPNAIENKPTAEAPTAEAPTAEAPTAEAPTAEAPTAEAPTAEAPEHPTAPKPPKDAPKNNTKENAIHNLKWVLDDVRKTYAPIIGGTDFIKVLEAMARAMRKASKES